MRKVELINDDGKTAQRKQSPCQTCPFRSDIDFELATDKAKAILSALQGDGDFPCHNTTTAVGCTPGNEKGCTGAAIFLEHVREGGLRANLAFRLRAVCRGDFDLDLLDMDVPIFTSEADFIAARTVKVPAN